MRYSLLRGSRVLEAKIAHKKKRVRHVFLTHPHFIRNCAGLLGEVVVGAEEMAQFGQQLLGLLQDVEVEQRRLLRQCCAIGRQAVEVLLAQGGETEFERLDVL